MTHTLTDEQIDALEGRELDAAVAEHVMGWGPPLFEHEPWVRTPPEGSTGRREGRYYQVKNYSTDIAAAFQVAQHMAVRIFQGVRGEPGHIDSDEVNALTLAQCSSIEQDGAWMAAFRTFLEYPEDWEPENVDGLKYVALAPTASLAICRAALKAVAK